MFENLEKIGYEKYLEKYPFNEFLNIKISHYKKNHRINKISKKIKSDIWASVSPDYKEPYQIELDDLIRLHYLVTSRKVTTVLEFGVGVSTFVLNHALVENEKKYKNFVTTNLRRANAFELHSVDNDKKWIKHVKKKYKLSNAFLYRENCRMSTFGDRICTYYDQIPNICPDFIYLDAPHQFSVLGQVKGISTRHLDRVPMAADILSIEHFLLPGTLIVVDGRTANARFLERNFQRNWKHTTNPNYDQHFFELIEKPLGYINLNQIQFSKNRFTLKNR